MIGWRRLAVLAPVLAAASFLGAAPSAAKQQVDEEDRFTRVPRMREALYLASDGPAGEGDRGPRNRPALAPPGTGGEEGVLALLALPERYTEDPDFPGRLGTMTVLLVNRTGTELALGVQDGRVHLVQQALDLDGSWRSIESFRSSFCGNSYSTVSIPTGWMLTFSSPRYAGPRKTKLRFRLHHRGGELFSNEFDGSIFPGQLMPAEGGRSNRLMDPTSP